MNLPTCPTCHKPGVTTRLSPKSRIPYLANVATSPSGVSYFRSVHTREECAAYAAITETTTYGVFFGDNAFPSATFPTLADAERYLFEMGVAARIKTRTDVLTPGIVAETRVAQGEWTTYRPTHR